MIQRVCGWWKSGVASILFAGMLASGCGEPTQPANPAPAPATVAGAQPAAPAPQPPAPAEPAPAPATEPAPAPAAEPAPAAAVEPATAPAAEYVSFIELRINRVGETLPALKAFLDRSVPMVSALAMGEIYPVIVHSNNLDGLDGKKAIRVVVYFPRQAITSDEAALAELEPEAKQPLFAEFVPVADKVEYLDKLGEEIDEIVTEGDYQKFTMKDTNIYFKFAGDYAIFSNSMAGVDQGVKGVAAVAAADAQVRKDASAVIEIRPREMFAAAGLSDPAKRKAMLDQMEKGFDDAIAQQAERMPPGMHMDLAEGEGRKIFAWLLSVGEQTDAVQLHLNLDQEACSTGMTLKATPGSELAKRLNSFAPAQVGRLRKVPDTTAVFTFTGANDSLLTKGFEEILKFAPVEAREQVQPLVEVLRQSEGQAISVFTGFDKQNRLVIANDLNFKAGTDLRAVAKKLIDMQKKVAATAKEENQIYAEISDEAEKEVDGWQVLSMTITNKTDNPELQPVLEMSAKVMANPSHVVLMSKGTQMVYAIGADAAAALATGMAFAENKTALDLKPEFKDWLTKDAEGRGAAYLALFDTTVLAKRVIGEALPDPKALKLVEDTIGNLNPLVYVIYAKDGVIQAEMRVEAETVKQWVAFVMQMQILVNQQNGGAGDAVPMPPPPGEGQDF